jgi:hypothetical protein
VPVRDVERQVGRGDRTAQHRGVYDVGQQPGLDELLAAGDRLLATLLGQRDIDPAGEQVLRVPFALSVAQQDQGAGRLTHG